MIDAAGRPALALILTVLLWLPALSAAVATGHSAFLKAQLNALRFQQHPGAQLPLDTQLVDESGAPIRLGTLFKDRPVIVVMEYLRCRSLCGFVLSGLEAALDKVPLVGGKDYQVAAISIDPRDTPADARAAHAKYRARASRGDGGWHFMTGSAMAVRRIADVVGFPYRYDPAADQYAHPAGIMVASPDGTISRYLLGLDYAPLDLRLALTEAGKGAISTPASDLLLLCYCYDPETGRYSGSIASIMRILGGATVLALGGMVASLSFRRTRP